MRTRNVHLITHRSDQPENTYVRIWEVRLEDRCDSNSCRALRDHIVNDGDAWGHIELRLDHERVENGPAASAAGLVLRRLT